MSSPALRLPPTCCRPGWATPRWPTCHPRRGLYACLFGGLVFWLFCSSRHTTITVTSAISLLVGASLGGIAGGDTTLFGALAAATALLVALIAFIAWLAKAGSIISFISESVMVGFKCGVALFLASTQLPKLFGIHGAHGNFWENSGYFLKHLQETNPTSLTVGGAALAGLVLGKIFLKNKPVALFVVVGGILASGWLGLEAHGVKLLGEVPQGLPPLGLPGVVDFGSWQTAFEDFNNLLPLAFACFLLAAVETAAIGSHLCRQARRASGRQPGISRTRRREPSRRIGSRIPGQRRHVSVAGQRGRRGAHTAVGCICSRNHSAGGAFLLAPAVGIASTGAGRSRVGRRGRPVQCFRPQTSLAR